MIWFDLVQFWSKSNRRYNLVFNLSLLKKIIIFQEFIHVQQPKASSIKQLDNSWIKHSYLTWAKYFSIYREWQQTSLFKEV